MTVAALATANAAGGIGIVRISGEHAIDLSSQLAGRDVAGFRSHTMHLCRLVYNGVLLDTALVCVFKAPNSYTGEDVVEFQCHGGVQVCRMVLEALYSLGAVPAPPGEFTKRAFLNGKLDLSQAEAVADLISADTAASAAVAASQLERGLSDKIDDLRQALVDETAHLLATIDFSEEGVEEVSYGALRDKLQAAREQVGALLATAQSGRLIRDGVRTAIIGTPNVGKSSILNVLCGEERAIVTDVAGTTRDVIETCVQIKGCKLRLLDTAGIRESGDRVEQIGVERSRRAVLDADLLLLVLDVSRPLTEQDRGVLALAEPDRTICLLNKCDLPHARPELPAYGAVFEVSAAEGSGFEPLFDCIAARYSAGDVQQREIVTNPRHRDSLLRSKRMLDTVLKGMEEGAPFDLLLGDIEAAISVLGEIGGATVSEELIDNIFANFCVGK